MWMQTVNKDDVEVVYINITNTDAASISVHYPAFKWTAAENGSSVSVNEGHAGSNLTHGDEAIGAMIGLAYEDIASGVDGVVQAYGYHESFLVARIGTSVTVAPGSPTAPYNVGTSVGMTSAGNVWGYYGPVIALDTVGATLHSLGTVVSNWADHCLVRCL